MKNKKILILVNHEIVIYNFRKELVEKLLEENYQVIISSPAGDKINELVAMGVQHLNVELERHGRNPFNEIKLINYYRNLMKTVKPDIVLTYTIKPNIYGGIVAQNYSVPHIANVTGLGIAAEKEGILQKLTIILYKLAFRKTHTVFFQNTDNQKYFRRNNIAIDKHDLLPGSGVNLKQFEIIDYPGDNKINFVFISRIMKSKGIEEYLEAAKKTTAENPNVKFHICGFLEEKYEEILKEYEKKGIIQYHGMIKDIRTILKKTNCIIHPSYHEGMSNVLLESAASGRPILASNIPGCIETFDEGISGFGFQAGNTQSMIQAIQKFLSLSRKQQKQMGLAGRTKMETEFDRQIVVERYLKKIEKIREQ